MPGLLQSIPSAMKIREELEQMVLKDLLGPVGGAEEEIDEPSVWDRYLVGMLAPKRQERARGIRRTSPGRQRTGRGRHFREHLARETITVVVETPNRLHVQNEYSTLHALGEDVARCSTVYYWPREHRTADATGKLGILHVKCAVRDGQQLFLSSANLTKYAFNQNMELGVLISGGQTPRNIESIFETLIRQGALCRV